ncbi:hypothetical protein QFC20_006790 [Naganishia adeliensis]|uniref:Uncharacterized protein n=1 Tax=Naganishia adeliensis TaxID=92952 RepID=A0ACC2V6T1_9TREE|nr:hypothetical protein QFC20_006790 [Naganishia adeliensis]
MPAGCHVQLLDTHDKQLTNPPIRRQRSHSSDKGVLDENGIIASRPIKYEAYPTQATMKTFAILLLCISLLTLAAASHSIEPTKFSLAAETPDAAAHVDVKETIVPIKRQDAGLPPQSDFPLAVAAGDSLCAPYEPGSDPSAATSVGTVETESSLVMATP